MALKSLSLKLSVLITKHGKRFVAYTPALDIATSGKSEMDVKVKFQELVSLFFEEVAIEGTINGRILKNFFSTWGASSKEKKVTIACIREKV